jgi:hypothetical protein
MQPIKSQYFEYIGYLNYFESLQFCQFLKGNLLHLNSSELGNLKFTMNEYWVPITKWNNTWKYDQRVLNKSEEISFQMHPGLGSDDQLCLSFNIDNNIYIPKSCENDYLQSFCHLPAKGLIFKVATNSTSKCTIEAKYNLFSENSTLFFAGLFGKLIIKYFGDRWIIFENNFDLKEQTRKATFFLPSPSLTYSSIFNVIGIHQIECNNTKTNETAIEYLKITNVSDI